MNRGRGRGVRPKPRVNVMMVGLVAFSLVANIANLRDGASLFGQESIIDRAALAGLEIARPVVAPAFYVEPLHYVAPPGAPHLQSVDAKSYFSFIARFGSPAYTPQELARAPENAREAADVVLIGAERLSLAPASTRTSGAESVTSRVGTYGGRLVRQRACLSQLLGPRGGALVVTLPAQGLRIATSAHAVSTVKLRRFGDAYGATIGTISGAQTLSLTAPRDDSTSPWTVMLTSTEGSVTVCGQ
jgi:hypothetical protein